MQTQTPRIHHTYKLKHGRTVVEEVASYGLFQEKY